MRAIRQIVDHLAARGLLDAGLVARLRTLGLVEGAEALEQQHAADAEAATSEAGAAPAGAATEDGHEAPSHMGPSRRRRGGGRRGIPKGQALKAEDLCDELVEAMTGADASLAPLVQLARQLPGGSKIKATSVAASAAAARNGELPWITASHVLIEATNPQLDHAIAKALRAQKPDLAELWDAATFARHRLVPADPSARGPAIGAFRAVLLRPIDQIANYRWILKFPPIVVARDLTQAQMRVMGALGRLTGGKAGKSAAAGALMPAILQYSQHRPSRWAMAILHTARRHAAAGGADSSASHEELAIEPGEGCVPDVLLAMLGETEFDAHWSRAWAEAAMLDAAPVKALLPAIPQIARERAWALVEVAEPELRAADVAHDTRFVWWLLARCPSADQPQALVQRVRDALTRRGLWRFELDGALDEVIFAAMLRSYHAAGLPMASNLTSTHLRDCALLLDKIGLALAVMQPRSWDAMWGAVGG